MKLQDIINKYYQTNNNNLIIGGKPASEIAREFGTPAYVYDFDILKENYRNLRQGLTEHVKIFYSMKANPSLAVCAEFCALGTGIETASIGEIETALKAGFSPDNIIYAGPGKTIIELKAAIEYGISSINAESIEEIKDIGKIAAEIDKKASVSIRVNPAENISGSHMKMGGAASPFGIDQDKVPDALQTIKNQKNINFKGIHVYVGNQIFDYQLAIKNILNTIKIAKQIKNDFPDINLDYVNLGGGLGIPYYPHEQPFELDEFKLELNDKIKEAKKDSAFKNTLFILELGRFLTAACGVFLTQVVYTKESGGRKFAVLDGGMNFNSIATGNMGQKIRRNFPLCAAHSINSEEEKYDIVGPLCTPADLYGRDYKMPPLKKGDIIAALFSGAYGLTASPINFLSHFTCAEIAASKELLIKAVKCADIKEFAGS